MTDPEWMWLAASRGLDTNVFYVEVGGNDHAKAAKAICSQCRVREDCLEFAIANREKHGIWGGLNEKERRNLRRRRLHLARRLAS